MGLILVDTSVWVDHIRRADPQLDDLVRTRRCVMHPFVLGEIALGNLPNWATRIVRLQALPSVDPAPGNILFETIKRLELQGSGLGFVDAHLLAVVSNRADLKLWSRDKRLAAAAEAIDAGWKESVRG